MLKTRFLAGALAFAAALGAYSPVAFADGFVTVMEYVPLLSIAAKQGNVDEIKRLLASGADIEGED